MDFVTFVMAIVTIAMYAMKKVFGAVAMDVLKETGSGKAHARILDVYLMAGRGRGTWRSRAISKISNKCILLLFEKKHKTILDACYDRKRFNLSFSKLF